MVAIPPCGVSPLSAFEAGSAVPAPSNPPIFRADAFDPATGELASMTAGVDPIVGAVQDAFTIRRGSGAVTEGGHAFDAIKHNEDQTPRRLQDEAGVVLKPFIDRRDIDLLRSATQSEATDQQELTVDYYNRAAARKETVRPA
jgi:hypothetical protein